LSNTENLGLADITLTEIIEEKIGFEMPEIVELVRLAAWSRKKSAGWVKSGLVAKSKLAA